MRCARRRRTEARLAGDPKRELRMYVVRGYYSSNRAERSWRSSPQLPSLAAQRALVVAKVVLALVEAQ